MKISKNSPSGRRRRAAARSARKGGDEEHERDQPRIGEQQGHFGHAADVLDAAIHGDHLPALVGMP